ncbi:BREX-3 system P-loop-containing protein BrxF [Aeromonas veronii]|uniref:BREX-3 system P-loop-containing protein BrxF n=1 Tax=Aeromonas veronii TaxID=654 RepID=UPI001371A31C
MDPQSVGEPGRFIKTCYLKVSDETDQVEIARICQFICVIKQRAMLGQPIHVTSVSSAYELQAEANKALLRMSVQSSALVLVINSPTQIIRSARETEGLTYLELSEQLCERLLPLSCNDRSRHVSDIIAQMLNGIASDVVWLDRIQVLFEPTLELDPLRQLQDLARLKPIVAIWPGQITERFLTFSVPGRDDYQSYSANDLANVPIIHVTEQRG